ncbi:MAG: hypothetical protein Fues2KO_38290 [Fuerstiella sp.]
MSRYLNPQSEIESLEPLILMSASTIEGSDGADWLWGTDADDSMFGFGGDDDIHGLAANNLFAGDDDQDEMVVYEGNQSQYTLEVRRDGSVRFSGSGVDGRQFSYSLNHVESININDGRVTLNGQETGGDELPDESEQAAESDPVVDSPVGEDHDSPVQEDPPSDSVDDEPPVENESPVQDESPVENESPVQDESPVEDESQVDDSAQDEPPLQSDDVVDSPDPAPVDSPTDSEDQPPAEPAPGTGDVDSDQDVDPDQSDEPSNPSSVILGTDEADWLSGTDADDVIDAKGGNDIIHAPVGNNTIDGGTGYDRLVIYDGARSDYVIETAADGTLQVRGPGLNSAEVAYSLSNVEEIEFTDGVITVSRLTDGDSTTPPDDSASPGTPPTNGGGSNAGGRDSGDQSTDDLLLAGPGIVSEAAGAGISAFHRSGQTFLTWDENTSVVGEQYHVYRHTELITAANLRDADRLTDRWGPLDDDTSIHRLAGAGAPGNFVIEDLGQPLSDDTGLFVYTTQDAAGGQVYYAVTTIVNGVEDVSNLQTTAAALSEAAAESTAVLVDSRNNGRGLLFTQFMDYADWNPTFQGYAYNYAVALPSGYDANTSYGLKLDLHAHSEGHRYLPEAEYNWDSIQLLVDDPGADRGTTHTWWFGFSEDHNYLTDGDTPTSGTVRNFTQQRVLEAVDQVRARFNVDDTRIHAQGNSMGASGALSLGIHYGDVFAGIMASQPMTNYASSPEFQNEFQRLWGTQAANLAVELDGPYSADIQQYSIGGSQAVGVWEWMNHHEMLQVRRGEPVSFLVFGHGKQDDIIDWETQGRPFIAAVNAADVGHAAWLQGDAGHTWMGFIGANVPVLGGVDQSYGSWDLAANVSFPSITNSSDSGSTNPGDAGDDLYNLNVDWATTWNRFGEPIVDTADRYEVTIRSLSGFTTADVTPRKTQAFRPASGSQVNWSAVNAATGAVLQSGQATVDSDGLVTVENVGLLNNAGTRLVLTR